MAIWCSRFAAFSTLMFASCTFIRSASTSHSPEGHPCTSSAALLSFTVLTTVTPSYSIPRTLQCSASTATIQKLYNTSFRLSPLSHNEQALHLHYHRSLPHYQQRSRPNAKHPPRQPFPPAPSSTDTPKHQLFMHEGKEIQLYLSFLSSSFLFF